MSLAGNRVIGVSGNKELNGKGEERLSRVRLIGSLPARLARASAAGGQCAVGQEIS